MTTHDKLTKIRAKCEEWIKTYDGSPIPSAKAAIAGWRATIAAIDGLRLIFEVGPNFERLAARDSIRDILFAWPDELLED